MKYLTFLCLLLKFSLSSKVSVLSYNTAGIFRRYSDSNFELKKLKIKLATDLIINSSFKSELFIFAFQEVWDVSNVLSEVYSNTMDMFRKNIYTRVLKFTKEVVETAFYGKEVECYSDSNHSLMTVACRFLYIQSQLSTIWFKSAFKFGWDEYGKKTSNYYLGFKGLIGTVISLDESKQLLIINLHLSSKTLEDRRIGILTAKKLSEAYLSDGRTSVILVGDFNARSFSLVLPDPSSVTDYKNNIGGAYLMFCLAKTISKPNFERNNARSLTCDTLLDFAKRYDDIKYIFKREFKAAKEIGALRFEPTFCFDFHAKRDTPKSKTRLCPKESETIPSYTDRIFYVPVENAAIDWLEYDALPAGGVEFSDHQAILGTFEIKDTPLTFSDAYAFPSRENQISIVLDKPYRSNNRKESLIAKRMATIGKVLKVATFTNSKIDYEKRLRELNYRNLVSFIASAEIEFKKLIEEWDDLHHII